MYTNGVIKTIKVANNVKVSQVPSRPGYSAILWANKFKNETLGTIEGTPVRNLKTTVQNRSAVFYSCVGCI